MRAVAKFVHILVDIILDIIAFVGGLCILLGIIGSFLDYGDSRSMIFDGILLVLPVYIYTLLVSRYNTIKHRK